MMWNIRPPTSCLQGLQAFDIPLAYITHDKFNQPIFGCNHLAGELAWGRADTNLDQHDSPDQDLLWEPTLNWPCVVTEAMTRNGHGIHRAVLAA